MCSAAVIATVVVLSFVMILTPLFVCIYLAHRERTKYLQEILQEIRESSQTEPPV
jgi:hypothetical protein